MSEIHTMLRQTDTKRVLTSFTLISAIYCSFTAHAWFRPSKMTYIVSGGALNSIHSLTHSCTVTDITN